MSIIPIIIYGLWVAKVYVHVEKIETNIANQHTSKLIVMPAIKRKYVYDARCLKVIIIVVE